MIRKCLNCGKELPKGRDRYCSSYCIKSAWRKRNIKKHNETNRIWRENNPDYLKEYHYKNYIYKGRYANSGSFKKGLIPWNKGTKGIIKPNSGSFRKGQTIGEKNSHWKGGIYPENKRIRGSIEFRLWREAVFARDNWTCQKCNKRSGSHHPHHIQNFAEYPRLRFVVENGITFCKKCHRLFHKLYGFKNNNKKQIKEFING